MPDTINFEHENVEAGLTDARDSLLGLINRAVEDVASGTGIDAATIDDLRNAVDATTSQMRQAGDDAEITTEASKDSQRIAEEVAGAISQMAPVTETGLSSGAAPSAPTTLGSPSGGAGLAQSPASGQQAPSQAMMGQQMAAQQQFATQQRQQQQQMAAARQQMQAQQQAQAQQRSMMQQVAAQQQAAAQQSQSRSLLNSLGQTTSGGSGLSALGADSTVDKSALREEIYDLLKDQEEGGEGKDKEAGQTGEGDYVSGENYEGSGQFSEESEGRAIELAQEYASAGIPYVWGGGHGAEPGQTGGGLDCSGLARDFMWKWKGIDINGTSETMFNMGQEIHPDDARPGDLWFPDDSGNPPGHVGVYIGNGQVVEAQTTGTEVGIFEARPGSYRRIE